MSELTYQPYNKTLLVIQGDRKLYSKLVNQIGGRWNGRLKNGVQGWTIPIAKEQEVKNLIKKISGEPEKSDSGESEQEEQPAEDLSEVYKRAIPKGSQTRFHRAVSFSESEESSVDSEAPEPSQDPVQIEMRKKVEEEKKHFEEEKRQFQQKQGVLAKTSEHLPVKDSVKPAVKDSVKPVVKDSAKSVVKDSVKPPVKDSHKDSHRDRESHRNRDSHKDSHRDRDSHKDSHRDRESHKDSHRDRDSHKDSHRDRNSHRDRDSRRNKKRSESSDSESSESSRSSSSDEDTRIRYYKAFGNRPSNFRKLYAPSESDDDFSSESDEDSTSSDDYPRPDTPKRRERSRTETMPRGKRGDPLLDKVRDMERKLYKMELERKKGKYIT